MKTYEIWFDYSQNEDIFLKRRDIQAPSLSEVVKSVKECGNKFFICNKNDITESVMI